MATTQNFILVENGKKIPISDVRAWVQLAENTLLFLGEEWKKIKLNFELNDDTKERIVDLLNSNEQKLFPTIKIEKNFKEGIDLTLTYAHTRMFSLPLWMITQKNYNEDQQIYHLEFSNRTNIPPLNMPMTLHPTTHYRFFKHIEFSRMFFELLPQQYNLFTKTDDSADNKKSKSSGGAVFVFAKGANVEWFKKFALEISKHLYDSSSHKPHFLLMKNDCLWVSIDHETSTNIKVVCEMILKYVLWYGQSEKSVEIDPDCCVTEEMISQIAEFEYNDSKIVKKAKKVEGTSLPVDHMIICCVRDKDFQQMGIYERFKKRFKKLWPNIKEEDFHFIIFKYQNKEKSIYLYIHVDGLSKMCLNASFDAIGQDFLQSMFRRDDITLENLKLWSIDDQIAKDSKNSPWM